jgi:hypothetical protein
VDQGLQGDRRKAARRRPGRRHARPWMGRRRPDQERQRASDDSRSCRAGGVRELRIRRRRLAAGRRRLPHAGSERILHRLELHEPASARGSPRLRVRSHRRGPRPRRRPPRQRQRLEARPCAGRVAGERARRRGLQPRDRRGALCARQPEPRPRQAGRGDLDEPLEGWRPVRPRYEGSHPHAGGRRGRGVPRDSDRTGHLPDLPRAAGPTSAPRARVEGPEPVRPLRGRWRRRPLLADPGRPSEAQRHDRHGGQLERRRDPRRHDDEPDPALRDGHRLLLADVDQMAAKRRRPRRPAAGEPSGGDARGPGRRGLQQRRSPGRDRAAGGRRLGGHPVAAAGPVPRRLDLRDGRGRHRPPRRPDDPRGDRLPHLGYRRLGRHPGATHRLGCHAGRTAGICDSTGSSAVGPSARGAARRGRPGTWCRSASRP